MNADQIREHMEAAPFRPFVLLTRGGGRYPVPHPEFAWFSPDESLIVVGRPKGVCVLEIAAVEGLDFAAVEAGGGI